MNDIEEKIIKNKDLFFLIVKERAKETHFDLKSKTQVEIKEFINNNLDEILIKFQQKNIEFIKKIEANKSKVIPKVIDYLADKHF